MCLYVSLVDLLSLALFGSLRKIFLPKLNNISLSLDEKYFISKQIGLDVNNLIFWSCSYFTWINITSLCSSSFCFLWPVSFFCSACRNYVVQFILELKIAYATSKLISQFEGNYVHLSTQKFSSHVVEKCLSVSDDVVRSNIIHELLSANHFEQLLQDPHANYVVQTALRVSEVR